MSLDVYLESPEKHRACPCCGKWLDSPDDLVEDAEQYYSANITHNLNNMALAAGLYKALWRPEEDGITKATQLLEPLRAGLARLLADPAAYCGLAPANGWGTYEGLVEFVRTYLAACEANPEADVRASR